MELTTVKQGNEIALGILERLLAGERGQLPLYLGMLLEKSSPLDSGDDHYRQILPPELAELRVDLKTGDAITAALCESIAQNPDSDLMFAIATTGRDQVTRLAVDLLIRPPRALTVDECAQALGIISSYLPSKLSEDHSFVSTTDKLALAQVLLNLRSSESVSVRHHAERLTEIVRKAES